MSFSCVKVLRRECCSRKKRNGVTWLLAGMCKLIDKRKCNSLCVKHTLLRMRATTRDIGYVSKQWMYMTEGVEFTKVLKLYKRQKFCYLF
jgi:hypothetical protein